VGERALSGGRTLRVLHLPSLRSEWAAYFASAGRRQRRGDDSAGLPPGALARARALKAVASLLQTAYADASVPEVLDDDYALLLTGPLPPPKPLRLPGAGASAAGDGDDGGDDDGGSDDGGGRISLAAGAGGVPLAAATLTLHGGDHALLQALVVRKARWGAGVGRVGGRRRTHARTRPRVHAKMRLSRMMGA